MRQLIVLVAVTLLLLTFPVQYALEQKNHHNISQFQKIVNSAKEEARVKGYFTNDIINKLESDITNSFKDIETDDIVIEVTQTPKYRTNSFDDRELLHYKIGIPIKKLIAANGFWGVSDIDNQTIYYIENYATSELPQP